jgi:glycosyltransferase involved in cell wall biosynthesis
MLAEPLFAAIWFCRHALFRPPDLALIYCFHASCVVFALLARLRGIAVVSQIEDVSLPALSDWRRGSETRPVQQLLAYPLMRAVLWLAHGVMVPTRRFKVVLPPAKPCLVVTGCVERREFRTAACWPGESNGRLEVLFLGKYEAEHGLLLLVETLQLLRRMSKLGNQLAFHCCGTDRFPEALAALAAQEGEVPRVHLHGYLTQTEYEQLLGRVHVGLVLQRSQGRHSRFKTPSKGYELMAAGLLVISTDVGDFADLAPKYLLQLGDERPEALVALLGDVCNDRRQYESVARAGQAFASTTFDAHSVGRAIVAFVEALQRARKG